LKSEFSKGHSRYPTFEWFRSWSKMYKFSLKMRLKLRRNHGKISRGGEKGLFLKEKLRFLGAKESIISGGYCWIDGVVRAKDQAGQLQPFLGATKLGH